MKSAMTRLGEAESLADRWRSLRYFNRYRLVLAGIFLVLGWLFGASMPLGTRNWSLFFIAAEVYALLTVLTLIPLWLRKPGLQWQMAWQVGSDIALLTLISYASGGIQSNIGLLLMVTLAEAGMISHGKMTLFFAALASIATLLEHSYGVLYSEAEVALYLQVGLLCMAYFAVAWLAHALAKYGTESQQLARQREIALAIQAEANRLVMRDMQDGVLVVDDHGVILQMNPGAERLLRSDAEQGTVLSEAFPVLYAAYALWRQSGAMLNESLQLGDGMQARLRFAAINREDASATVIFLEDILRVQAEAQQIKLAALGRLTANIAHEVRNPLSSISYAAELLQEDVTEAAQRRLLQIVLDNTQRINRIVQDVMQINRRDRAKPERLDLDEVIKAFIDEFVQAERTGCDVVRYEGGDGIGVEFDRGHLSQVLWNLCRNALRHGSKGIGSVTLQVAMEPQGIVLEVRDDGPGIDADQASKLFEPFFTTESEGTGLGLYIARELCEANGAQLTFRADKWRKGACFRIAFRKDRNEGAGHGE